MTAKKAAPKPDVYRHGFSHVVHHPDYDPSYGVPKLLPPTAHLTATSTAPVVEPDTKKES